MGCFSAPKQKYKSLMDPGLKKKVFDPLVGSLNDSLFTENGDLDSSGSWAYSGPRVAGASDLESQAFDWAKGLQGQTSALQDRALDYAEAMPDFSATTDYTKSLWGDISGDILERYGGMGGAASGGAQSALMDAGKDLTLGLQSQLAQQELAAKRSAADSIQNINSMGLSNLQMLSGLGGTQRGISQSQLTAAQQAWAERQAWANPALQYAFPTSSAMNGTYVSQPAGMGYSMLTGMAPTLGQAGAGAAIGALTPGISAGGGAMLAMLSDRRLKENIKPIEGALDKIKKLRAYRYNYTGNSTPRIGLIAQDVEAVFPEAVTEVGGVKMVDVYAVVSLLVQAVAEAASKGAE